MKIEKAIEIITAYIDDPLVTNKYDFIEALKLGIEALKRHRDALGRIKNILEMPLPGETKD